MPGTLKGKDSVSATHHDLGMMESSGTSSQVHLQQAHTRHTKYFLRPQLPICPSRTMLRGPWLIGYRSPAAALVLPLQTAELPEEWRQVAVGIEGTQQFPSSLVSPPAVLAPSGQDPKHQSTHSSSLSLLFHSSSWCSPLFLKVGFPLKIPLNLILEARAGSHYRTTSVKTVI